jgi:hypothetical protein
MQTLPASVARYFANDDSLARAFTEDAVVVDEKHEHRGRAAIVAWRASTAKYNATAEPLRSSADGDRVTVAARVTGTFPGSPIELRFHFTLHGELISRLEIGS